MVQPVSQYRAYPASLDSARKTATEVPPDPALSLRDIEAAKYQHTKAPSVSTRMPTFEVDQNWNEDIDAVPGHVMMT